MSNMSNDVAIGIIKAFVFILICIAITVFVETHFWSWFITDYHWLGLSTLFIVFSGLILAIILSIEQYPDDYYDWVKDDNNWVKKDDNE